MPELTPEQLDLLLAPEREQEWIETFLTVPTEHETIIPWKLTEQQVRISRAMQRLRKVLIVKGRQTRCSTILLAKWVRRATVSYGTNFVIITQTDQMTQNFRQFIKDRFVDLANIGMEFSFDAKDGGIDNSERLRLATNKCTFHFASAEQKVGLRGIQTAHVVHASEVAHWPDANARKIIGGILPANRRGIFVAESTPNGAAGWFYEKVADSMPLVPQSEWTTEFYPWWLEKTYTINTLQAILEEAGMDVEKMRFDFQPSPQEEALMRRERLDVNQMLWRRLTEHDLRLTGQYFAQEYPEDLLSCWLSAGVNFFQDDQFDHISYYRDQVRAPMVKKTEQDYTDPKTGNRETVSFLGPNFQMWEPPLAGHKYVAFQDVSAGVQVDGDYSALAILEAETRRHVATVRIRTLPSRVARMAAAACAFYNWAYLGVERNSYGLEALTTLNEMHYPNLYYDVINQPEHPELGWFTSQTSRELMCNRFREHVFNHRFQTQDQMAVLEMGSFSWRKVQGRTGNVQFRAEADKGNDDMVIALAGACVIAPYAPSKVNLGRTIAVYGTPTRAGEMVTVDGYGIVTGELGPSSMPWFNV